MPLASLSAIAGVAAALATAPPTASLHIAETGGIAGPATYTLTCNKAGGTLPRPGRACRTIWQHPELLRRLPQGNPFPCPFGRPSFHVTGTYLGRAIDARFIACFSGQWDAEERWATLVPDDLARLQVHPDRGIGNLTLGEPRTQIRQLLGRGRAGRPGTRRYPTGYEAGYGPGPLFPVGFTIAYRAGRAAEITSDNPATAIGTTQLSNGCAALRRRLPAWSRHTVVRCQRGRRWLTVG
jgi:hypothetical protein